MKIRFEITIDDMIAFNRFHCENSPMWRRQCRVLALAGPVAIGVVTVWALLVAFRSLQNDLDLLLVFGIAMFLLNCFTSIPLYFLVHWWMNSCLAKNTRKLLAEGSNRSLLGWCEMEIVNRRLVVTKELVETRLDMRAIEKIVANERYTFIYIASVSAYVIPKHWLAEDDYHEFVAELLETWDEREAPRQEEQPAAAEERIVERPF